MGQKYLSGVTGKNINSNQPLASLHIPPPLLSAMPYDSKNTYITKMDL